MFEFHDVVAFVFKLINVGVLVALAAYFFKRRGSDTIKSGIAGRRNQMQDLKDSARDLKQKQEEMEGIIKHDRVFWDELNNNAIRWSEGVASNRVLADDVYARRLEQLQKRLEMQQQSLHVFTTRKKVLASALDRVYDECKKKFAQEGVQREYCSQVVQSMKGDIATLKKGAQDD